MKNITTIFKESSSNQMNKFDREEMEYYISKLKSAGYSDGICKMFKSAPTRVTPQYIAALLLELAKTNKL